MQDIKKAYSHKMQEYALFDSYMAVSSFQSLSQRDIGLYLDGSIGTMGSISEKRCKFLARSVSSLARRFAFLVASLFATELGGNDLPVLISLNFLRVSSVCGLLTLPLAELMFHFSAISGGSSPAKRRCLCISFISAERRLRSSMGTCCLALLIFNLVSSEIFLPWSARLSFCFVSGDGGFIFLPLRVSDIICRVSNVKTFPFCPLRVSLMRLRASIEYFLPVGLPALGRIL